MTWPQVRESRAEQDWEQAHVLRYLDAILVIEPDSARDRVMRMITSARLESEP